MHIWDFFQLVPQIWSRIHFLEIKKDVLFLSILKMAYDNHLRHVCVLVVQSYLILCDPMDCSPPGSPVPGILLARAGCHSRSRGVSPIRGSKPGFLRLLHWQVASLPGKPQSIKSITDISWKCLHLIKTLISVRNTQGGTKLCMLLSVGTGAQACGESRWADGSLVVARVRRVTWEVCGGQEKTGPGLPGERLQEVGAFQVWAEAGRPLGSRREVSQPGGTHRLGGNLWRGQLAPLPQGQQCAERVRGKGGWGRERGLCGNTDRGLRWARCIFSKMTYQEVIKCLRQTSFSF